MKKFSFVLAVFVLASCLFGCKKFTVDVAEAPRPVKAGETRDGEITTQSSMPSYSKEVVSELSYNTSPAK